MVIIMVANALKGMFAQKCGITTIQLTTSMRKVPGSLTAEPSDDWACLLINLLVIYQSIYQSIYLSIYLPISIHEVSNRFGI